MMPNVEISQPKPAVNPLQGYYRQPKIYISLPSGGDFYPEGALDKSEDGRYPVYAMTAKDELMYKTPDALLSGAATVEVIQSCVPSIKDAWKMPTLDVDACLVAIRIATYGDSMEVTTVCPSCNEDQKYDYNLSQHLDKVANFTYQRQLQIGDLVINLRPFDYKELTATQIKGIEQERIYSIVNNNNLSEEEKLEQFGASFVKLTELTVDIIVQSISSIDTPQGSTSDRKQISEFINNADKQVFQIISDHLDAHKHILTLDDKDVKCGDCEHEFKVSLQMDQANFFAVKS